MQKTRPDPHCSLSAARCNPSVGTIYQKLKAREKPDKAARIAAARKLLIIAHAVYRNQEMYCRPESGNA
ncbi:MAG: hypothetical protein JW971_03060 [Synergistales bacterium]|nr:hypothetical protein [Synergistales bacterium]